MSIPCSQHSNNHAPSQSQSGPPNWKEEKAGDEPGSYQAESPVPRAATFSPTHFDKPPNSEDELLKLITLGQNPSPSEPDAAANNLPSSYPYHLQAHDVHSSVGGEEDIEHKFNKDPSSSDDYDIDPDIDVGDEGHGLGSLDAWEFHSVIQATHNSLQTQLVDPTLNQDTQSMLLHQNSKHLRTVKKMKAQPHSKPS